MLGFMALNMMLRVWLPEESAVRLPWLASGAASSDWGEAPRERPTILFS